MEQFWSALKLTVAPMPTPTGLTAMAQGETPTPVKPKFRAATESWKRFVLEEKKVGGVMATAFFITCHSTPACQGCLKGASGIAGLEKADTSGPDRVCALRCYSNLLHGRKGNFCPLPGAHAGKTCQCQYAGDTFRWHACKHASGVGLMYAKYGLTSSTKPLTSPFWSFSRVLACAATGLIPQQNTMDSTHMLGPALRL